MINFFFHFRYTSVCTTDKIEYVLSKTNTQSMDSTNDWLETMSNLTTPLQLYSLKLAENVTNSTEHMTNLKFPNATSNYLLHNNNSSNNSGRNLDDEYYSTTNSSSDKIFENVFVQASFSIFYIAIFVIGIFGNVLVCYVVCRNKAMHTVTNFFITNLALSDILLCCLAIPFTPLYTFIGRWIFGKAMCHLLTCSQGISVYISTLTLTSIAMDRFVVIIYPFRHRMKLSTCICLITAIWICSLVLTLPYGMYMSLNTDKQSNVSFCEENWPSENTRKIYGTITVCLQFILPFLIIAICYILVSIKLNDRAKAKPGSKTSKKEEADRDRKKRTNRMLISMVAVFGISWLPLNLVNIFTDYYDIKSDYLTLLFFLAHCVAMSSTCYNPFLYAWLNENFRKEFKQVLPFFHRSSYQNGCYNSRAFRADRTFCNGNNESGQESLLIVDSIPCRPTEKIPRGPTCNDSIKKPIKVTIKNNEGFILSDVKKAPQQLMTTTVVATSTSGSAAANNVVTTLNTTNNTKSSATGVLETQFDVIALSD